jgi:hypothetical protein
MRVAQRVQMSDGRLNAVYILAVWCAGGASSASLFPSTSGPWRIASARPGNLGEVGWPKLPGLADAIRQGPDVLGKSEADDAPPAHQAWANQRFLAHPHVNLGSYLGCVVRGGRIVSLAFPTAQRVQMSDGRLNAVYTAFSFLGREVGWPKLPGLEAAILAVWCAGGASSASLFPSTSGPWRIASARPGNLWLAQASASISWATSSFPL